MEYPGRIVGEKEEAYPGTVVGGGESFNAEAQRRGDAEEYPGTVVGEGEKDEGGRLKAEGGEEYPGTVVGEDKGEEYPGTVVEEKGVMREIVAQGREIGTQAAAGVTRDLPRMIYDTAAAVLPGEAPSPSNPQGTGAAGWAGRVSDDISGAESGATWDDAKKRGWAGVPGMAARSLAPNLLAGFATGGASVAAMPWIYGGSRAEQIYRKQRDAAELGSEATWTEEEKTRARLNAAGAGLLEGGLEYVSNLVGVNRQVRELMRGSLSAGAARAAVRPLTAWLRGLRMALVEGGTEFVQEGGGELHEQLLWISDQIEERPETIMEITPEGWGRIWDAAKYAAGAGVLSSGAVGGIQAAERKVRETRAAREARENEGGGRRTDGSGEAGTGSENEGGGRRTESGAGLDEQAENYDEIYPEEADGAEGAQPAAGAEDSGRGAAAEETEAGGQRTEGGAGTLTADDDIQRDWDRLRNSDTAPAITPEQEEKALQEAEKGKRKDAEAWRKANKGKGAAVSDLLMQNHPVAAKVLELGGIRGDGTEDQWGLPAAYRNPESSNTLDTMLKELATDEIVGPMVADWTTNDLKDALTGNKRAMARTAREKPVTPEEREWLKNGSVTVGPENLALGFTFSVKGRSYVVADADEDGYVIEERGEGVKAEGVKAEGEERRLKAEGEERRLKAEGVKAEGGEGSGKVYRLGHGGLMTVDKDSVRSANGKRVLKMRTAARPEDLARFEEGARQREEAVNAEAEARARGLGSVGEKDEGRRMKDEGDGGMLPGEDAGTDEDLPFRLQGKPGGGKIAVMNGERGEAMFRRVTPEQNAAYMKAVESGDMETAQSMVDAAAKRAGYTVVYGDTNVSPSEITDLRERMVSHDSWFKTSSDNEIADAIRFVKSLPSKLLVYRSIATDNINMKEPGTSWTVDGPKAANFARHSKGKSILVGEVSKVDVWLKNMEELYLLFRDSNEYEVPVKRNGEPVRNLHVISVDDASGRPIYTNKVFYKTNAKSADAITRDDSGNVISLSERFNEKSDDIRFREAPKPRARGVTIIRRGYDEERAAADDPTYSRFGMHPMDLPELVELAEDLLDGKTPRMVRRVNPKGTALGSVRFGREANAAGEAVYGRPETIKLLAANYKLISDDEAEAWRAELAERFGEDEAGAAAAFGERYMAELKERMKRGPRLAMSVIAHEIGHVADQMTRYGIPKLDRSQGKNRLNLVGRVAGMLSYTRDILAADPAGRTLNRDEVRILQAAARRNARPDKRGRELFDAMKDLWAELPAEEQLRHDLISAKSFRDALEYMAAERPVLSEWFAISTWAEQVRAVRDALGAMAYEGRTMTAETRRLGSAWFRQEFVGQLEKRRQAHLGKMYSELEGLLGWWNGGERAMMEETLETPGEMFAEAFGVYLNNPKAVQKRAPMFWRTLNAYMESRPQVQEWLEEFNAGMSAGPETVLNRRLQRVRENFSEETREARSAMTEAARRTTGRRTAWDMTKYLGVSKSLPLRALVRTAERMRLKGLADAASGMADRIENLRGLEDLYRTMNLEVGRILDEGDLTVQDFDAWGLLDMAARSPAYAEKANPNGLHPEAARQTREEYRRQLGDARAATLERAVAKAQEIWRSEIVTRLEQWGGYDEGLIAFIKGNPVYFTLQVGMDKAELAAWQAAIRNQDMEQIAALAQRNIEKGTPGAGKVGAEIHARKGTHRMPVSLLGATMLKGQALLADAAHNEMKRIGQALLIGVNDPLYTPIGEGETGRDTLSQVVVKYRQGGKEVAYYAPKYVGHFLRGDNPASGINRGLRTSPIVGHFYMMHQLLKAAQTVMSVKFMLTQPWSDRKAWNTQMPGVKTPLGNIAAGSVIGGLAQMMPAGTWYLPAGMFPAGSRERMMRPMRELARAYYRTGKIDAKLRTLIERGMYDLGGAWQGMQGDNPHPGEIIGRKPLSATPKSFETYAKETRWAGAAVKALGQVPGVRELLRGFHWTQESMYAETLANKLAGMDYLDAKYPGMDERQKREWVLKGAGNPNFASRGGADPLIDVLAWAFYNPAKEGWRSAIYAAKTDPKGFALRTAYYNVVPSMLAHAAKLGLLAGAAAALIPHGETPEEEEKREGFLRGFERWCGLFGRIGTYYNKRYVAIPIAPVGQDSALTVTIPQAQSFAPLNSLVNLALDEAAQMTGMKPEDDKGIEKAIQAVTGEMQGIPSLLGMSRGMPQQVFGPALALLFLDNTNTYDPFYGKMQLDREEEALMKGGKLTARAMPAWNKVFKNAWNSAGGNMFGRFDTKTPRADTAQKTELQKILTAPGIGALVGGWLRVTGGGEYESLQEMFAPEEAERAHKSILARRAAVETLESKDGAYPKWAAEMLETDVEFARAVNRFRVRADVYEGLTPQEKIIMNRANPRWKREMVIERDLNRRLKEREPQE